MREEMIECTYSFGVLMSESCVVYSTRKSEARERNECVKRQKERRLMSTLETGHTVLECKRRGVRSDETRVTGSIG